VNVTHARVTNHNEFPIDDRYDGIPYVFKPGIALTIPLDAAAAIFGMPVDDDGIVTFAPDTAYMARRWGWNVLEKRDEKELTSVAMERLIRETSAKIANIKVEQVSYILREVSTEENLPPPRETAMQGDGDGGIEGDVQHGTMDEGDGAELIDPPGADKDSMLDRVLGRKAKKAG
jgi:hypothetical protein